MVTPDSTAKINQIAFQRIESFGYLNISKLDGMKEIYSIKTERRMEIIANGTDTEVTQLGKTL